MNAIDLPSGEKRGMQSHDMPLVRRVALPPSMGIEYRSPRMSNTIVRPSGDTSSEIQVASSVVNRTWRVPCSGSLVLVSRAATRGVLDSWAASDAATVNARARTIADVRWTADMGASSVESCVDRLGAQVRELSQGGKGARQVRFDAFDADSEHRGDF